MAQQVDISTKTGLSVTGTSSVISVLARGKNEKGTGLYRIVNDTANVQADSLVTLWQQPKELGYVTEFKIAAPVMKAVASSGDIGGYTAVSTPAAYTRVTLRVERTNLMTDADCVKVLEQLLYSVLTSSAARDLLTTNNALI